MGLLSKPADGRPWYSRLTVLGAIIYAAAEGAEKAGVIPPGTTGATVGAGAELLGQIMALIGIYRQVAGR